MNDEEIAKERDRLKGVVIAVKDLNGLY